MRRRSAQMLAAWILGVGVLAQVQLKTTAAQPEKADALAAIRQLISTGGDAHPHASREGLVVRFPSPLDRDLFRRVVSSRQVARIAVPSETRLDQLWDDIKHSDEIRELALFGHAFDVEQLGYLREWKALRLLRFTGLKRVQGTPAPSMIPTPISLEFEDMHVDEGDFELLLGQFLYAYRAKFVDVALIKHADTRPSQSLALLQPRVLELVRCGPPVVERAVAWSRTGTVRYLSVLDCASVTKRTWTEVSRQSRLRQLSTCSLPEEPGWMQPDGGSKLRELLLHPGDWSNAELRRLMDAVKIDTLDLSAAGRQGRLDGQLAEAIRSSDDAGSLRYLYLSGCALSDKAEDAQKASAAFASHPLEDLTLGTVDTPMRHVVNIGGSCSSLIVEFGAQGGLRLSSTGDLPLEIQMEGYSVGQVHGLLAKLRRAQGIHLQGVVSSPSARNLVRHLFPSVDVTPP